MEFLEVLNMLKKHVVMIVVLCATTSISALLFTYLIDEKYEAKALVLVSPSEEISISAADGQKELLNYPVSGGGTGAAETPSNTYIEIIKSRAIAEKVVRRLELDAEDEGADTFIDTCKKSFKNFMMWTKQVLKYGRYVGKNPPFDEAVELVQEDISLVAIKDTHLFEITYASEEPDTAADVVNVSAELFLEYMADIDTAEARNALKFLETRLRKSAEDLAEARQALRDFKLKNKTVTFTEETSEEIKNIYDLETSLQNRESLLAGLLKAHTSLNPDVQSTQAEVEYLVSRIAECKERVSDLPEMERQLAVLELNVDVAADVYQLIKKAHEEAELHEAKVSSEMRVVSPASGPIYPSDPIRGYYVVTAFALSLLSGIGMAFFFEYLNTRICTVEAAESVLQLPVLATLPRFD